MRRSWNKRRSWNNRFRLIRKRMKRRMKMRKRNGSRTSSFSISISTLISTSTTTIITSIFTFNLNLTLFEPHPTPPSHSPQTLQCSLSSPYPLSPHSIPLVTSNFISITFCYRSKISMTNISITKCYRSKSLLVISVSIPVTTVIPTSSCFTR